MSMTFTGAGNKAKPNCIAIGQSSKISKFGFHHNKAKLKNKKKFDFHRKRAKLENFESQFALH